MTRDALYLVTLPIRFWLMVARGAADSFAVAVGLRWRDPYGRSHPRSKPRIPVARVVR